MLRSRCSLLLNRLFFEGAKLPRNTELGHFINGEFTTSSSSSSSSSTAFITPINPFTGQCVIGPQHHDDQLPSATAADVDAAVTAAHTCFETTEWRLTRSAAQRQEALLHLAASIERDADALARLESANGGKTQADAEFDVLEAARCFKYFAGLATSGSMGGATFPVQGSAAVHSYSVREPLGPVALICPFNYPLLIASWKLAPALAAGNTVVVKPSELTPLSTLALAGLVRELGPSLFPPGVVNVLVGDGATAGARLCDDPRIAKISFTGSVATGSAIARGARVSCRVATELGGKSAMVVAPSADQDAAVDALLANSFGHAGQICSASSRCFVHSAIHDEFVERLVAACRARLVPVESFSPVISAAQRSRVLEYCRIGAEEDKATCVLGGGGAMGTSTASASASSSDCAERCKGGFWVPPTIFTDCKDNMRIACEEIFGPVLCVLRYDSLDEAVARANDSDFGLAAGIFSRDVGELFRFAEGARAGSVWLNAFGNTEACTPFGGWAGRSSGIGRELGAQALDAYSDVKHVWLQY